MKIQFILTATAFTRDGSTFLVSSMVDRGGGDEVPASRSSSLSFELSRSLRFCLLKTNQINSISSDRNGQQIEFQNAYDKK